MDRDTIGCLAKLSILAAITCLAIQCCDDKDNLTYTEKRTQGTLIKTTSKGDYSYYFIDTDNDLKTPEYALITKAGSNNDLLLNTHLINHTEKTPAQLPLTIWRKYSISFQRVRN